MRLKCIGKIISNKQVAPDCYRIRFKLHPSFKKVTPGQFVHLRLNAGDEILLRRPFSIYNIINKGRHNISLIEILYQTVGKGTRFMATLRPGEKIDILGPLGNGFKINHRARASILVAGGIGVAGLHLLLKQLMDKSTPLRPAHKGYVRDKIYVLIGAKTQRELYLFDTYRQVPSATNLITTEDGSRGFKGLVTVLLERLLITLAPNSERPTMIQIYTCGPEGMIKKVCRIARDMNIPSQVSLERQMGCGLGICRACVCKVKDGKTVRYATVCSEGPVFEAGQIVYD